MNIHISIHHVCTCMFVYSYIYTHVLLCIDESGGGGVKSVAMKEMSIVALHWTHVLIGKSLLTGKYIWLHRALNQRTFWSPETSILGPDPCQWLNVVKLCRYQRTKPLAWGWCPNTNFGSSISTGGFRDGVGEVPRINGTRDAQRFPAVPWPCPI